MPSNSTKVLMTGAAGRIGCSLRQLLAHEYDFRCLDQKPLPHVEDMITADILDFPAVLTAMTGVAAVIHLAANPNPQQPWSEVYTTGIAGTYYYFLVRRLTEEG